MYDLHFSARSDLGLGSKTRNEDSAYAGPNLLLLCDGMGGHAGGDTASAIAVHHLAGLDSEVLHSSEAGDVLLQAVAEANAQLAAFEAEHPETTGMGTTCIAMVRCTGSLAIAHIGDSRAYRMQQGELSQITHDHSFLQLLIDEGHLTEEEAWGHPQRSLITRVLSGRPEDEPDHGVMPLVLGDRYLLCSDGLSDYVRDETIAEVLRGTPDPDEATQSLIALARRAGTRDNVTVVVADVVRAGASPSTVPQTVGAAASLRPGHELADAAGTQSGQVFVDPQSQDAPTQTVPVAEDGSVVLNGQQLVIGQRAFAPRTITREGLGGSTRFALGDQGGAPEDGSIIEIRGYGHGAQGERVAPERRRPGRAARALGWLLGVLALLALVVGGLWWWGDNNYYVGERDGTVQIRRGYDVQLAGRELSALEEETDLRVKDLPSFYATSVRDGIGAHDLADARRTVTSLQERADRRAQEEKARPSSSSSSSPRSSTSRSGSSSGSSPRPSSSGSPTG